MKEGDWVSLGLFSEGELVGFITTIKWDYFTICATKPYKRKKDLKVDMDYPFNMYNDIIMDDAFFESIIDISLLLKDKEWFMELTEDYALWKSLGAV